MGANWRERRFSRHPLYKVREGLRARRVASRRRHVLRNRSCRILVRLDSSGLLLRIWHGLLTLVHKFGLHCLFLLLGGVVVNRCLQIAEAELMIKPAHVRAVQDEVDLDNSNEVSMVSYSSKNVVRDRGRKRRKHVIHSR